MIKLKTFTLDKFEEANAFLDKQLPFTTEKGQGIQIHQGHIVVFYNDGIYNEEYSKQKFTDLYNKEQENIALHKHSLVRHESNLKREAPKGYEKGMSDKRICELFEAQGESFKIAREKTKNVVQIENDLLLTMHSIEHAQREMELYKKTIATYK